MSKLTPQQELFAQEYLVDHNGTQAAIRAGYSAKTAHVQASRLLSNVKVQELVAARHQALVQQVAERTGVTLERVVNELAAVGFSDIRKAVRWGRTVMVPVAPDTDGATIIMIPNPDPDGDEPEVPIAVQAHTPLDLVPSDELDDATAAAISEVKQTPQGLAIKMHSKLDALGKLYTHLAPTKAPADPGAGSTTNNVQVNVYTQQVTADVDNLLNEFLGGKAEQPTG